MVRTCSRCGATEAAEDAGLPPGWSLATSDRGLEFVCLQCTRRNIRAIEGKLPEEWWE